MCFEGVEGSFTGTGENGDLDIHTTRNPNLVGSKSGRVLVEVNHLREIHSVCCEGDLSRETGGGV